MGWQQHQVLRYGQITASSGTVYHIQIIDITRPYVTDGTPETMPSNGCEILWEGENQLYQGGCQASQATTRWSIVDEQSLLEWIEIQSNLEGKFKIAIYRARFNQLLERTKFWIGTISTQQVMWDDAPFPLTSSAYAIDDIGAMKHQYNWKRDGSSGTPTETFLEQIMQFIGDTNAIKNYNVPSDIINCAAWWDDAEIHIRCANVVFPNIALNAVQALRTFELCLAGYADFAVGTYSQEWFNQWYGVDNFFEYFGRFFREMGCKLYFSGGSYHVENVCNASQQTVIGWTTYTKEGVFIAQLPPSNRTAPVDISNSNPLAQLRPKNGIYEIREVASQVAANFSAVGAFPNKPDDGVVTAQLVTGGIPDQRKGTINIGDIYTDNGRNPTGPSPAFAYGWVVRNKVLYQFGPLGTNGAQVEGAALDIQVDVPSSALWNGSIYFPAVAINAREVAVFQLLSIYRNTMKAYRGTFIGWNWQISNNVDYLGVLFVPQGLRFNLVFDEWTGEWINFQYTFNTDVRFIFNEPEPVVQLP